MSHNSLSPDKALAARYRAVIDALPEIVVLTDDAGRICLGGDKLQTLLFTEADSNTQAESLQGLFEESVEQMIRRSQDTDHGEFEITLVCANLQRRHLLVNIRPLEIGEATLLWTLREITDRLPEMRALEMLSRVVTRLEKTTKLRQAAHIVLREVCHKNGWAIGEFWIADGAAGYIECVGTFSEHEDQFAALIEASRGMRFSPGEGLPGRVWQQAERAWISDVSTVTDAEFRRKALASDVGIHAACAIPVRSGASVWGVLVFFMTEKSPSDPHWLELLSLISVPLTSYLQRLQLSESLLGSRDMLRQLYAQTERAREHERKLMALAAHDELGQRLTGMLMQVRSLHQDAEESTPALADPLIELADQLSSAMSWVRSFSSRLRPSALDHLGLEAAVENHLTEIREHADIEVESQIDDLGVAFDDERDTAIFRVLQECLTNVLRHAQASSVAVRLARREQRIVLTVRDDGIGFNADQPGMTSGVGIWGMRERARDLGGTLSLDSQDDGTVITLAVPIDSAKTAESPNHNYFRRPNDPRMGQ